MQRAASRHSDTSDQEVERQAKMELASLHRQYRITEGNHKAYCEESQNKIRKQKARIALLQAERDEIQMDLIFTQSRQNSYRDDLSISKLQNLVVEEEDYEKAIQELHLQIGQLNKDIKELENEIRTLNKDIGGANSDQLRHFRMLKQSRVMENRLNKVTVEFNKLLTTNSEQREKIDHLRSQRVVFDYQYEKLTRELYEQKKFMLEVIEQSTQAYDQSDEAQTKMLALQERNEKDLAQYNTEYKEFLRNVEHDAKLHLFMDVKSQERNELEEEAAKRRAGEQDRAEKTAEETMQVYHEVLQKIKEVTGEGDVKLLTKQFINTERETLSLFNFVNEMSNEVEQLQDQIDVVDRDIKRFNDEGTRYKQHREKILCELDRNVQMATEEADSFDKHRNACLNILSQAKIGIESVFRRIECDRSPIEAMLGDNNGVSENNMMHHLRIIEQKADKLLQIHAYLQLKQLQGKSMCTLATPVALLGNPAPQTASSQIVVLPPSAENDQELDDEDTIGVWRPMTRSEMRAKVLRNVHKREYLNQSTAFAATQETSELVLNVSSRNNQKRRSK